METRDLDIEESAPRGKIYKYGGNGEKILVDDPAYLDGDGNFKKLRRKPTNYTAPKKKRKKR